MNLLLIILFAVGFQLPEPPPRALVLVGPAQHIMLTWTNTPAGVSNVIVYGPTLRDMTNSFYCGVTNAWPVFAPLLVTNYFRITPLFGGQPGQPSNAVRFPGTDLLQYFARDFDGKEFWSTTFTNLPPGENGQAMLGWKQWKDYTP